MLKASVLTIGMLTWAQAAIAQQAPVAGGLLQQIPAAPSAPATTPDIRLGDSRPSAGPDDAGPKVVVNSLRVLGAKLFPESVLVAASGFTAGSAIGPADLRAMAARITAFYVRRGYFVTQAFAPAQEVRDGSVKIEVVEGRYEKINLNNTTNLSNGLARGVLAGLNTGDPVERAALERRVLLLSDIQGVRVASSVRAGSAVGGSDLDVAITPGRRITGDLEADNAGDRYTGAVRGGGTINLNDPLGWGDVASLRGLTSGSGLVYVRASYQGQLGVTTVGAAYTHFGYELGKEFASLRASGTEDIASLYASYPLVRSRNNNLYAGADVDQRWFHDTVDFNGVDANRQIQALTLTLTGNHRDTLWGGGSDAFYLGGSFGNLDIRTPTAFAADAAGAHTNGQYGKLIFSADRLQTVAGPFSLYGLIRGQLASKNLDISEEMELGGVNGVRAYPEGEAYGDQGYIATVEGRYWLPKFWPNMPGRVQAVGFLDTGAVELAKTPVAPGQNRVTRRGAGVGLTWAANNNFQVKASYAFELGTGRATSAPDHGGQLWLQLVKFF